MNKTSVSTRSGSIVGSSPSFRIGVDIGGTFTDVVALTSDGKTLTRKVSSTPDDYGRAVAAGIEALVSENGLDFANASDIVHATTVATNAILEDRGARTGLITTEGFRDVLEFRRVRFPELYNLAYRKPKPLVPRRYRLEVRERLAADGTIRTPLDEASVVSAAERFKEAGVEAVAICLLHSYQNPIHERRVEEILRRNLPDDVFICCSYDILPEIREYERTSTTVVNAFLGPIMTHYLDKLQTRLSDIGLEKPLYVMQSGGGQMSVAAATAKPAYLVESGPAAGVVAAAHIAKQLGLEHIITLDIGGTTAKTSIVEHGEPVKTGEYEVGGGISLSSNLVKGAGYAIKLPFIDVSEIGSGGGSKVWFDNGGLLKVGPESAGSIPGPVCYGQGGTQVTFTDAVLALGYLNPDHLVGGALKLDFDAAATALEAQICHTLKRALHESAFGIFTVAVTNMVRAVKSVTTYRGRDPRDFTLVAFGGNGPGVAAAIAEELGVRSVLVPPNPGVLSAHGLLVAENTYESVRSMQGLLGQIEDKLIRDGFQSMSSKATDDLISQGFAEIRIKTQHHADLRYAGQAFELTVSADNAEEIADTSVLTARFHNEHERTYGHKSPNQTVEIVNIRVVARVSSDQDNALAPQCFKGATTPFGERTAYFGPRLGLRQAKILTDRASLGSNAIEGPVIIEEYDATTVVPPGWYVALDDYGSLLLNKGER
jgi:N-methylhydantoinase A